jgi:hypothetical protein
MPEGSSRDEWRKWTPPPERATPDDNQLETQPTRESSIAAVLDLWGSEIRDKELRARRVFMLVREISQAANDLDLMLDEYQVTPGRRDRRRLLERGTLLSIRGVELLVREPFIQDPENYLYSMSYRLDANVAGIVEELRHDSTTLQVFLSAEVRLLQDLGLTPATADRIRQAMQQAIIDGIRSPDGLAERLDVLLDDLRSALDRLYDDDEHQRMWRRLTGVLQVLGGALVIAGNAVVGAAATPVSAGVTAGGAAVSTVAGAEVITRGVDRTHD